MTKDELAALAKLESRLTHVRAAVQGVVREFHTGLFLHGEGGTSKSFTVVQELQRLKAKYTYHNTRITGRGLVEALEKSPGDIHFIEDAETLLDDKHAWGVLRSALWSQSTQKPMVRPVTWRARRVEISFNFTGGIIVISNQNLADSIPEVRAIKSRINVLHLDVSAGEIAALMKKIAISGYRYGEMYLDPEECLDVRQFVIDKLSEMKRPLDLRMMVNGFRDMLQYKSGESPLHWRQLLEGRMSETATYQTRDQKNFQKSRAAAEIDSMKLTWNEKVKLWTERTKLSAAAFDRARKRRA